MTIVLNLAPEQEARLRARAAKAGLSAEELISRGVAESLNGGSDGPPWLESHAAPRTLLEESRAMPSGFEESGGSPSLTRDSRPRVVQRLQEVLEGLATHVGRPEGGVYASRLEQVTVQALEQLFDDGFLSLVLAVRHALLGGNAWMRCSPDQVRGVQALIEHYAAHPPDNGLAFRKAALELRQLGLTPLSMEVPAELLWDAEA
jgi:hypothetical protein